MSTIEINQFSSFKLTNEEELLGQVYTDNQLKVLQNLRSIIALEIVALRFDPNNPLQFTQIQAELTGKLGIIEYLIDSSTSVNKILQHSNHN